MSRSTPALRVDGARQLRAALRKAGVSVEDLKEAHRQVAALVLLEARGEAPVRSGALRDSGRSSGTQSAAVVRYGGARTPYANPVHWGWPKRNWAAQPWAAEAAERTEPSWSRTYLSAIEEIIRIVEGTHP